jgi:hypothetical protein
MNFDLCMISEWILTIFFYMSATLVNKTFYTVSWHSIFIPTLTHKAKYDITSCSQSRIEETAILKLHLTSAYSEVNCDINSVRH